MIILGLLLLAAAAWMLSPGIACAFVLLAGAVVGLAGAWQCVGRQQYLCSLFTVVFLAMFIPNPVAVSFGWIDIGFGAAHHDYAFRLVNSGLLAGLALFLLGARVSAVPKVRTLRPNPIRLRASRVEVAVWILLAIGLVGVAVGIAGGGWQSLSASRVDNKMLTGNADRLRLVGLYFVAAAMIAPVLIVQLPKRSQIVQFGVLIMTLALYFMLYRARTAIVGAILAATIGVLLRGTVIRLSSRVPRRRSSLRRLAVAVVLLATLASAGISLRFIRGVAYSDSDVTVSRDVIATWLEKTVDGGDLGFAVITRAAVELFPRSHSYLWGQSYYRLFFAPIPRSIWESKPRNTQVVFCEVYDPDMAAVGGTVPPGIVGDLYINFGPAGILGMFVFGLLMGRERYRTLSHYLFLASSLGWMVHFTRGAFTNPVYMALFTFMLCKVVEILIIERRRPQNGFTDNEKEVKRASHEEVQEGVCVHVAPDPRSASLPA